MHMKNEKSCVTTVSTNKFSTLRKKNLMMKIE